MTQAQANVTWRNKAFSFRLLLSYLVVPWISPVFIFLFSSLYSDNFKWAGSASYYFACVLYSFVTVLALGKLLLPFYLRRGWTGFIPFMAGGGICEGVVWLASSIYYVFSPSRHYVAGIENLVSFGILPGLLYRIVLFGFFKHSRQQQEHANHSA